MFERVGYDVIKLVRISMGSLDLEMLDSKQIIELDEQQISDLKKI